MPPRRSGLGRGLDALIAPPPPPAESAGGHDTAAGDAGDGGRAPRGAVDVELGRIQPNPRQPRRAMDEGLLAELAASIREHGLIQPLVVTRLDGAEPVAPPRYQLIAGERRWQAAKLAGLVRVPVVVREATPRDLLELALVENVQRADLNPLEEAAAYQQLAQEFGLTQEQIGERVGKSRFAVANTLRLLHLPARVQQAILDGQLTEGHARALLGLADKGAMVRLAQHAIDEGLSVRQTEELVRRAHASRQLKSRPRRPQLSADVLDLEERFRSALGTKVSLTRSRRGGRLTIHYYDDEQLQDLYDRLAGSAS